MHSDIRKAVIVLLPVAFLSACVSINSVTPEPAAPGDVVRLHLSNVIGPMSVEPGAMVTFDGMKMPLDPDTGLLEVITILPLFRRRSDSTTLVIGAE
jgi:hypothetical protein